MPTRPQSLCAKCRRGFDRSAGRCPVCWPPFSSSAWRTGGGINRRRWARVRALYLADFPLCQWAGCRELAHEVDHIRNLKKHRGIDPYDRANLQSLCSHHHRIKTGREGAARARGGNDE